MDVMAQEKHRCYPPRPRPSADLKHQSLPPRVRNRPHPPFPPPGRAALASRHPIRPRQPRTVCRRGRPRVHPQRRPCPTTHRPTCASKQPHRHAPSKHPLPVPTVEDLSCVQTATPRFSPAPPRPLGPLRTPRLPAAPRLKAAPAIRAATPIHSNATAMPRPCSRPCGLPGRKAPHWPPRVRRYHKRTSVPRYLRPWPRYRQTGRRLPRRKTSMARRSCSATPSKASSPK